MFFSSGRLKKLTKGNKMVEKAKIVKDAVMTAAVIAVAVGFLAFLAGGL